MFVSSKHTEEEFDSTFGENKREFSSSRSKEFTQSGFRELTFEMKSSKPRSEAGRSLRVPAELDFHPSTCRSGKREALSRCGAPSAEEGFAVAGIKNASGVRRVTVLRAEPAVDKKGTSMKKNSSLKEQHFIG